MAARCMLAALRIGNKAVYLQTTGDEYGCADNIFSYNLPGCSRALLFVSAAG